ncbi:hypothetical protein TWF694_010789 [Orbilia ellipsospora]|uniref:Uncharacterized protein n=1 Tax=Orbilia ellipsospora TaxID=2528407 RepID=A0AAV9X8F9_9PEZI
MSSLTGSNTPPTTPETIKPPPQSLEDFTKEHAHSSNDCLWMYELLLSAAKAENPTYHIQVLYHKRGGDLTLTTAIFESGKFPMRDLEVYLASVDLRAVILCHRESSRIDPQVFNILWANLGIDVPSMRLHFDYKRFRYEKGCSEVIQKHLKEEQGKIEEMWRFGGRWNPIRLPSESRNSILRLGIDSECLSVYSRKGVSKEILSDNACRCEE